MIVFGFLNEVSDYLGMLVFLICMKVNLVQITRYKLQI